MASCARAPASAAALSEKSPCLDLFPFFFFFFHFCRNDEDLWENGEMQAADNVLPPVPSVEDIDAEWAGGDDSMCFFFFFFFFFLPDVANILLTPEIASFFSLGTTDAADDDDPVDANNIGVSACVRASVTMGFVFWWIRLGVWFRFGLGLVFPRKRELTRARIEPLPFLRVATAGPGWFRRRR